MEMESQKLKVKVEVAEDNEGNRTITVAYDKAVSNTPAPMPIRQKLELIFVISLLTIFLIFEFSSLIFLANLTNLE